tara:strand:+ start:562 stop:684 length:123 start_codon:yes stop_codon:yes gene_type:complete
MEEYWKALIRGLTPENEKDLGWYWKIPLCVIVLIGILSLI